MSIVITGASGHLGRATVELVLGRMPAQEVILTTRHPEEISDLAARGVEVREADFGRPETLVGAFEGGDKLLLISTDAVGARVDQHRAAIEAAGKAGISHVVYTSYLNPVEDNPAAVTADHRETERALRESGLAWTALRNGLYAEYQVPTGTQAVATGRLVHNNGDGETAYVSREDCAAAAAAVLAPKATRAGLRYHRAAAAGPGRRGCAPERGVRPAGRGRGRRRRGVRPGPRRVRYTRAGSPRDRHVRAGDPRGLHKRGPWGGREPYGSSTTIAAGGLRSPPRHPDAGGIRMSQHEKIVPEAAPPELPPTLRLGAVHLTVKNLDRSIAFYKDAIGLRLHHARIGSGDGRRRGGPARPVRGAGSAAGGEARGTLPLRAALPLPRGAGARGVAPRGDADPDTGCLRPRHPRGHLPSRPRRQRHRACRRPSARALAADHGVCRRPAPLDLDGLLAVVAGEEPRDEAGPGLAIGHVHLHVGDLEQGLGFYRDVLGFEPTALIPGAAAFVAAGGYHHHLGFNVWRGEGVPPAPQGRVGLRHWTVMLEEQDRSPRWTSGSVLQASRPRSTSAAFSCVTRGRSRSSSPPLMPRQDENKPHPGPQSRTAGPTGSNPEDLLKNEKIALTLTLREGLDLSV